jgi:hypothetical protein
MKKRKSIMATVEQPTPPAPQANSRPTRKDPAVIRYIAGQDGDADRWRRLLPAWIISFSIHIVLFGLFLILNFRLNAETVIPEDQVIETQVETETKPPNLENDEIGNDPELPTNYNVSRIEDVSVPGAVNPNEAVGITNAPEGPPQTLPPPPGFDSGQGGGVDSANIGKASPFGTAGGYSGPKMVPGGFAGRSGSTREQMLREGGGNTVSEAAVAAGLKWFARHQAPDGHWSLDNFSQHGRCNCTGSGQTNNDIAATAFGLLPFLAAGKTHKRSSDNENYYKNVEKGLKYLMVKQNAQGYFGGGPYYAQGLATIAVCEAFGLTSDAALKPYAQRALNNIMRAQNANGGWDYSPGTARTDTSVGGWQLMALKSGQMAGLDVPKKNLEDAARWLDRVQSNSEGSGYGYDGPGDTYTMTSVGLLCREYLGWGPRNPGLIKGVQKLSADFGPEKQLNNMYYYYYATQVMHHFGGEAWQKWNPRMRDMLVAKQDRGMDRAHPDQKGSWSPVGDVHGGAGGRIMTTSLSLLTLEVYYRYLPLYHRDMGAKDEAAKGGL